MIEQPKPSDELYMRSHHTASESIYKEYMNMRDAVNQINKLKYEFDDKISTSKEFKKGFIAGVKVMMSLFMDL